MDLSATEDIPFESAEEDVEMLKEDITGRKFSFSFLPIETNK